MEILQVCFALRSPNFVGKGLLDELSAQGYDLGNYAVPENEKSAHQICFFPF